MRSFGLTLFLCLACLLPPPGQTASAAPPPGKQPLVEIQVNPATLIWHARRTADDWSLRVTAPGGAVLDLTFQGAAPVLSLQDLRDALGGDVPDGSYTYEISAALEVDGPTRGEIESSRSQGEKPAWLLEAARDLRQSGSFRVADERFVYDEVEVEPGTTEDDRGETEGTTRRLPVGELTPLTSGELKTGAAPGADRQVVTDDLVVRDSACIGADCPFSPAFGTDTIRLQESNLRIKFDDSTASGSTFPDRDWELLANDPTSGGLDRFSIHDVTSANVPFTIEGDGPSNSLYLDAQGRIGLGTATPTQQLHLVDGDTPAVRIEQDATQSFPPQAWDLGGNEDGFFVRDVNNGLTVPFEIEAGALRESLVITDDARIGLGTDAPTHALHLLRSDGTAAIAVEDNSTTAAGRTLLRLANNGATRLDLVNQKGTPTDTSDDSIWFVQNESAFDDLNISKVGSGGPEIVVRERLDQNGSETFEVFGGIRGTSLRAPTLEGETLSLVHTGPFASRTLAELSNNGPTKLDMKDRNSGDNWSLRNLGAGFTIQLTGDPDTEFQLTDNGDLTVSGTLTQNSNRETKTAVKTVDAGLVLSKVLDLPIATWQRRGVEGVTHLGPMAQDFRALFGLGRDETSISPIDLAGVALAAVQALHQENQELRAQLQDLKALEDRLAALEAAAQAP